MRHRRVALHSLLLAVGLAGCIVIVPTPSTTRTTPTDAPAPPAALEREIHRLINQHRARLQLSTLEHDDELAELAREHSQAMASRARPFGHAGFEERSAAIARLFRMRGMAENVAYNSRTGPELASAIVSGWIVSPGHRKNLEGAYDTTGIGVAHASSGVSYVTQIFVKRQ